MSRKREIKVMKQSNLFSLFLSASLDLSQAIQPLIDAINVITPILLSLVFVIAVPMCITTGIKIARAEGAEQREEAKRSLIQKLIGFGSIFVLIIIIWLVKEPLLTWVSEMTGGGVAV